jgi:hypothetical protein
MDTPVKSSHAGTGIRRTTTRRDILLVVAAWRRRYGNVTSVLLQ